MRLVVTLLWCIAAVIWLPWALFKLRWLIDIAQGTPWDRSVYFPYVFMGLWPRYGWLRAWGVVSWWPVGALCGIALSAAGWRLYWLDQEGILTRPGWSVGLSIAVPPLAPFIMWADARRRHMQREALLESEVDDARARLGSKRK